MPKRKGCPLGRLRRSARHLLGPRLEQSQCNRAKPPKTELSCRYYSSHLHRLRRESAQARNRYRFVQPHSPTVFVRVSGIHVVGVWPARAAVFVRREPATLKTTNLKTTPILTVIR